MSSPRTAARSRSRSSRRFGHVGPLGNPLWWLAGLLAVYLFGPVASFVARLAGGSGGQLSSPGVGAALAVSAETATIATVVIGLLGVPLAYLLSRGRSRTSAAVGVAVQLPIALPPLMSGILLLDVVGPYTTVGRWFGGRLTDDRAGIVLAQVFVAAPFLVIAARSAFGALNPALDDVAATLGHRPSSRFLRVAVPAAAPGIVAGLLLAWLRAFGEFGATVVLAYHPYSLPVFTYVQFGSTGLPATMLPVAVTLLAAIGVVAGAAAASAAPRRRRRPAPLPPAAAVTPMPERPLTFELTSRLGDFTARAGCDGVRRLAIVGPSGAGKTLVLRSLAGLVTPVTSQVRLGDDEISGMRPERRGIGYVPQDATLLPQLPVWRQVMFGVDADPRLAAAWIPRLGLGGLEERRPSELSGGQRRRVAIARALSRSPRLLLLDEPFTGLDTPVRDELRRDLRRLQRETGVTTVVVSHDPDDAALLAEHVVVLERGEVLQAGDVPAVRAAPADEHVASLLGVRNVARGVVTGPDRVRCGRLDVPAETARLRPGTDVLWQVPPERVEVGAAGPLSAEVVDVVDYGDHASYELRLSAELTLTAVSPAGRELSAGQVVAVGWPPAAGHVWQPAPGRDRG